MSIRLAVFGFILLCATGSTLQSETPEHFLTQSEKAFYQNEFDQSAEFLEKYFEKLNSLPKDKAKTLFRFYAIAAMGRIFLQNKQDPQGAIRWYEKIEKSVSLTEAETDIVDSWIAVSKEWIKFGKFPKDIKDAASLYRFGKNYYEAGLKKQKYTMDIAGSADFSIAGSYLLPYSMHYDKAPQIGEVLVMLGDIRRRTWADNQNWSENYYLTESIRRFPGTPLAKKAYRILYDDVHFGYSGTSGDHTPISWHDLLIEFKKLAEAKEPVKKTLQY